MIDWHRRLLSLNAVLAMATLLNMNSSPGAAAEFYTGYKLHENCGFPEGSWSDGVCFGYITGVASALDQMTGFFCIPTPGVTGRQIEDVVKVYLRDHPEARHHGASWLVIQALKEKFPCN